MSSYIYHALKDRSEEVRGQVEAADRNEAVAKVRALGLYPLDIREGQVRNESVVALLKTAIATLRPASWLPPKKIDVVQTYRQLSLMLSSGHALLESLALAADLAKRKRLKGALLSIRDEIQRGSSFGDALAKFPALFPLQVVELVKSAEASGELDTVLLRLAVDTERMLEMKRSLITAMIYPAIIIVMSIGLMVLLAVWVLPKMVAFIDGRGVEVPRSTAMLINVSNFVTYHGVYLAVGIGAFIFMILSAYTTLSGKRFLDAILLRVPLIGQAIISGTMAQNGWTLSMLSASGVTLLESLKICARITDNIPLKERFSTASESILQGVSLSRALEQKNIPELFYKMSAVGEQSGELDRVMLEVGNYFNNELQSRLKRMLAVIEPALMLLIGGPVAFVYLSIFQMIFVVSTGGH